MTPDDAREFVARLTLLAEALAEPLTPTRIAGYVASVDDLELADLAEALNDCARTCRFFPRPVEIRLRVGQVIDRREALALAAYRDRLALAERATPDTETPALPAPAPEPAPTEDERADAERRHREGWEAFMAKWRDVAGMKAMPEARRTDTVRQIAEWRRKESA